MSHHETATIEVFIDDQDVSHLFDDEKHKESILFGASLDISWLTVKTKQNITEAVYIC